VKRVARTLNPDSGDAQQRKQRFGRLRRRLRRRGDAVRVQMAVVMAAFAVGLFAGSGVAEEVVDNLELERWFRLPKGHARRIHGRKHAGVRLVQEGATLMPVVDAHKDRDQPYPAEQLQAYRAAQVPKQEQEALQRRKVMRRARSRKQRSVLLAELEHRYQAAP
jgi:hypothetical protein